MPKLYTEQDLATWKQYLEEGMPYSSVAEVVGVNRQTIARRLPGLGMPMEEARKLGTFVKNHNRKMKKLAVPVGVLE